MMFDARSARVWIWSRPIDFRKGVNGLSALVSAALGENPYCGDVFVFRSKRRDRLKLLAFDGSGMILATKWLEEGAFVWPPIEEGRIRLSATQLALLTEGLDWRRAEPRPVRRPLKVA
jgi:transposase